MDGITPRQGKIFSQNSLNNKVSPNKTNKNKGSNEPKDKVSLKDRVRYTDKDLTPNGTLKVIIESKDNQKLEELKEGVKKDPKSHVKADLPIINGFSAEIDPKSKGVITMMDNNTKIFLDGELGIFPPIEQSDNKIPSRMNVAAKTMGIDKLWEKGYTGKDVTICVLDTGVAQHPDYKDRIVGFKDFVNGRDGIENAYDDNGHGTHCTGIAAGDGASSSGKYKGAAPDAKIVGGKVLSGSGGGSYSNIIKGIQWALENKDELGIDIISMSLGGPVTMSTDDDPVVQAVEKAIDSGVTTLIAAGNSGPYSQTIGTPGSSPKAITVGALDDKGTINRDDDGIARFSSRGPTRVDGHTKPDILSPGVNITAPKNTGGYTTLSGTSMATPLGAGMAALLKQAAPDASPKQLKEVIKNSADKLDGKTPNEQGSGVFDVLESFEKLTGKKV